MPSQNLFRMLKKDHHQSGTYKKLKIDARDMVELAYGAAHVVPVDVLGFLGKLPYDLRAQRKL